MADSSHPLKACKNHKARHVFASKGVAVAIAAPIFAHRA